MFDLFIFWFSTKLIFYREDAIPPKVFSVRNLKKVLGKSTFW